LKEVDLKIIIAIYVAVACIKVIPLTLCYTVSDLQLCRADDCCIWRRNLEEPRERPSTIRITQEYKSYDRMDWMELVQVAGNLRLRHDDCQNNSIQTTIVARQRK
jgi:hypothetical protein